MTERSHAFRALSAASRLGLAVLNAKLDNMSAGVPHSLYIGLTGRCQLKCSHCRCRQGQKRYSPGKDLSFRLALKALKMASACGIPRVIFVGGEPTLYPELPRLTAAASDLGLFSELDTNGLRLLEKAFLGRLRTAGLCAVKISLHAGAASDHDALAGKGAFRRAVASIGAAKRAGLLTYVSSCLFSRSLNAGEDEKLLTFAEKAGVHGLRLLAYSPEKGTSSLPADISTRLSRLSPDGYARTCVPLGGKKCAASSGGQLYIDPRGTVKICPYAVASLGPFPKKGLAAILLRSRRAKNGSRFPCQAPDLSA